MLVSRYQMLLIICTLAKKTTGLLIGVWYAFLSVNYLFVQTPELFTIESTTWKVFHGIKAGFVFLSLVMYLCVSRWYQYRLRDEVVNEQYLIEEIYERELDMAEQYNADSDELEIVEDGGSDREEECFVKDTCKNYGSLNNLRMK